MSRVPFTLRLCLGALRVFSLVVPPASRADWRQEWEAELRHRWQRLDSGHDLDWRNQADLMRRSLGALPDAAWLRRQFTADSEVIQDVRYGARALRQTPAFAITAIVVLALGIGGAVSVFTLLDTLMLRALPYEDAERIVTIWQRERGGPDRQDVAPANFLDWRERARSLEHVAAVQPNSLDYTGAGEPEVLFGAMATDGFFEAFGVRPQLGRTFTSREYAGAGGRVAVITYGLWQRRFGGNPAILDTVVSLDGQPWTIVGVLPRKFAPQLIPRPKEISVWAPKIFEDYEKNIRGSAWWNVVARLKPGVTLAQAQAEMDAISAELAREYPATNERVLAQVLPLREHLSGPVQTPLVVMMAATVLVLAIGCANVASLLLARGLQREREFAIRAALGAGRARLVRQLVTESLLLSAIACTAGVGLARFGIRSLVALAPGGVVRLQEAAIDGRTLFFALGLTTVTALAFGLVPALHFSCAGHDAMRDRSGAKPRRIFRQALVAAEVALAVVLLAGAGLLIKSFGRLVATDPGFVAPHVVALQVFAWDRNQTADRLRNFFDESLQRLRELPGVEEVGAVSAMPFIQANIDIHTPIAIAGRPVPAERDRRGAYFTVATPGYFRAMSIPLHAGRLLHERDDRRAARVVLINETLRRQEWPADDPIGDRITVQWQGRPIEAEVVGVVGDVRHEGLDRAPRPEVFFSHDQVLYGSMTFVLRAKGEPGALIDAAKRAVWTVDRLQPFYDTAAVQDLVDSSVVRQRFSVTVMSIFALFALALCATGIYGIVAFTTTQRTREIGVRMALGADASAIRRMVFREALLVISAGLVCGVTGAVVATRFLTTMLFEIRPGDPATMASVCMLLAIVGLAACYVPARRATRVDPLVALRSD